MVFMFTAVFGLIEGPDMGWTVIAVSAYAALGSFLFMCSLYLQDVRHYSSVHPGLIYLAMAVTTMVSSPLSGRLVGRLGTRPSLPAAGASMTIAALLLSTLSAHTPAWERLIMFALFGFGFGMVNTPITTSAESGMPQDRAGAASAVASTSRQVGVSIGVALCGSPAAAGLAVGHVGSSTATLWWWPR